MTEAQAVDGVDVGAPTEETRPPARVTPMEGADLLMLYFQRRRDVLIAELREIDRLLGRPQTIPERYR